jgi:NAD(P)-dependent dehydrogenase (short-subunit alcohol dehydrogenase family)
MAPSLPGKVVIVTGAARGLGAAIARGLLAEGAGVGAADLPDSRDDMEQLVQWARRNGHASRLVPLITDVTDPEQCVFAVDVTVTRLGGLHALVNNAGRLVPRPMRSIELDPAQWRGIVDVNVNGPFFMMRAAAPILRRQGWGRIVNVTTSRTTLSKEGFGPYGPSKAALEAATLLWSREFAGSGVTVNCVLPGGGVRTRLAEGVVDDVAKLMPPEIMVPPVLYLCSAESDGVTGMRFVGKDWDPQRRTGTPAGFQEAT